MKKILLFAILGFGFFQGNSTIYTVVTTGSFSFSPATVNAMLGDTVVFSVSASHNAVEVSSSTWAANGTTPLGGGFNITSPGGVVILTATGIRYYVCTFHVASMGMKGQINVSATGIFENDNKYDIRVFPNPTADFITLDFTTNVNEAVNVDVFNLVGVKVMDLDNGNNFEGSFTRRFEVASLPKGIYFINISVGDYKKSIKFVKK